MENKTSINHENGNDANRLLAAAAIWWERLTPLKKELFESKYGKIDNQKINDIYKMHTDWSNEDLEQVSNFAIITLYHYSVALTLRCLVV